MGSRPENFTAQGIFDHIVAHLRKQGKQALNAAGDCVYRATDGCECAFGCIIPDDEYDPRMEGTTSSVLVTQFPAANSDCSSIPCTFPSMKVYADFEMLINSMQDIHDNHTPHGWEDGWESVAAQYGLTYTPPVGQ